MAVRIGGASALTPFKERAGGGAHVPARPSVTIVTSENKPQFFARSEMLHVRRRDCLWAVGVLDRVAFVCLSLV